MKKLALLLIVALPLVAEANLFSKYESVRQAFLKNSLTDVNQTAAALAADARAAKNDAVATRADAVAKAPDMAKARAALGALSEEMIRQRERAKEGRPAVYHCPMVGKSWLQPKGEVGNPYDGSMKTCGVLKAE